MRLFKRNPGKPELIEPDRPPFADQCRHVRTRSGRTAHLEHPGPQSGVLCGWRAEWVEADLSLPVCRLCEVAAMIADEGKAS